MSDEDKKVLELRDGWYKRAKEQSLATLPVFLQELAEHPHDYNTICYAVAAGAVAGAWAIERCPSGGITGFQASAVMWEFMEAWNGIEAPARLLKIRDMLYPQNSEKFNTISAETWQWLQDQAKKELETAREHVHPNVIAHWQSIRDGAVPFGYAVRD